MKGSENVEAQLLPPRWRVIFNDYYGDHTGYFETKADVEKWAAKYKVQLTGAVDEPETIRVDATTARLLKRAIGMSVSEYARKKRSLAYTDDEMAVMDAEIKCLDDLYKVAHKIHTGGQ